MKTNDIIRRYMDNENNVLPKSEEDNKIACFLNPSNGCLII